MIKFALSSDSTSDIYKYEARKHNIFMAPLSFVMQKDGETIDCLDNFSEMSEYTDFFVKLKEGTVAKTSMLNLASHIEHFDKILSTGVNDIVHLSLSYGLSPTYENAVKAAEELKEKYPKSNIYCVDSKSASIGQNALLKAALKMQSQGAGAKDVFKTLEKIKQKLSIYFIVDDLNNLKRGGRVSGAQAMIGTMLNLKPILSFDKEGKLDVIGKVTGSKKAIKTISEKAKGVKLNKNFKEVYVVYTGVNLPEAELLKSELDNLLGVNSEIRVMGPIIGAHVGPGGVGYCLISD